MIFCASVALVEINYAAESKPCSACPTRSDATISGSANLETRSQENLISSFCLSVNKSSSAAISSVETTISFSQLSSFFAYSRVLASPSASISHSIFSTISRVSPSPVAEGLLAFFKYLIAIAITNYKFIKARIHCNATPSLC